MRFITKAFYILFLLGMMTGFRMFPNGNKWPIDSTNTKLWIKVCPLNISFTTNDLPSTDPLYGQTVTLTQALDSIRNDFTNVPNSYIVLADAATDPEYNATIGANRTIDICSGSTPGTSVGYAKIISSGGLPVGCEITVGSRASESLKNFISTMTHEIGHCVGLDHAQETTHAIMSYYKERDMTRLQIDDKMGLIYMYPENPEHGRESNTFGLSCAPRE